MGDPGAMSARCQCVCIPTSEMAAWIVETEVSIWKGESFKISTAFKILKCAVFRLIARLIYTHTHTHAKAPTEQSAFR